MKKFIIILLAIILGVVANAQTSEVTFKKEGTTYSSNSTRGTSVEKKTGFTWKDSKGVEYPIYMSSTGSCYIKRISSKTGKEYKQYLGKEVSADICAQLGVKYTPRN